MVFDLSGTYKVYTEDGSVNTTIKLPGSSCEAQIGVKQEYLYEFSKASVRAPRERYEYIGQLFYEREFVIPEGSENCEIYIFLERVNMASKLWIDGILVGRGVIGLSTPHIYKLNGRVTEEGKPLLDLKPGKHSLKLMIDNRDLLHMGDMASGYSVDTQGYWNGVIGRMELVIKPINNIENVSVFPDKGGIRLHTVLHTDRQEPMKIKTGKLTYELFDTDNRLLAKKDEEVELFSTRQRHRNKLEYAFKKSDLWDEFSAKLFRVKVTLNSEDGNDCFESTFGYRTVSVRDKEFRINDKPISLRGTINCAQYPLTGYPPMDVETWEEHLRIYRECGLNHLRFHAWCPPEAAFVAADRLGIYFSVEMPLWINRDVTPYELGDDEWHSLYYRDEALKISEWYGNHPSFVFFPCGNENMGDYALMETIIEETKAIDNRRLYTITSNFDHPLSEVEDYQCACEICHMRVRNQTRQAEVAEGTFTDYSHVVNASPVPFTSFEVGQYGVYPDVDICEDYSGNMLPVNFELIRGMMKEKGVYGRLKDYVYASGKLAFRLYKEDIEAVLRTKKMGGFQLLSLVDYTGQSTATVGMIDIFHRDKSFFDKSEWVHFCNDVVPLFAAKRIFSNNENLKGEISLYNFSGKPAPHPTFKVCFGDGVKAYKTITFSKTDGTATVDLPLDFIKENTLLYVTVSTRVGGKEYSNSWRIFVFVNEPEMSSESLIADTPDKLEQAAKEKRFVLVTPGAFEAEELSKNNFIPVFWSPAHFKTDKPCGAMIDDNHEALKSFPTDGFLDYQWKELMDNSFSLKYGSRQVKSVVEMVPNFVDNVAKSPLCEFEYKGQKLLFCGFDLNSGSLPVKALKNSLLSYVKSKQ